MTDWRGKLILSNEDVNNNKGPESKEVLSFADLPSCILEMIMSYLLIKDNIRASAVCKAWREAAEYVRVVEKHPWVISIPKRGSLVYLFDPLQRKVYTRNLPEIAGTNVCYSKDGWLLMYRSSLEELFFFHPYTRELISLPKCKLSFQAIAFSSAPTSGTCALVAINLMVKYLLAISICYLGATEWITMQFPFSLDFDPFIRSNLVYANGHFFFFAWGGILFDIDPASRTLNHQAWDEHRCLYIDNDEWLYQPKTIYLMEHKGELFLMYTCGSITPLVYKLVSSKWEEISSATLDGLTIFASFYSSEARMDVLGMRNSVYFAKYGLLDMQCASYSFDDGMHYPCQLLLPITIARMRDVLRPIDSLWIEPPP